MSTADASSSATTRTSERELARLRVENATLKGENRVLHKAYEQLLERFKLLKHRLFIAKAERINTEQLELEFAEVVATLEALTAGSDGALGPLGLPQSPPDPEDVDPSRDRRKRPSGSRSGVGRRDLSELDLPEERVEILDPTLEETCERIGFDETSRLGYRRPSRVRIVVATAKYKREGEDGKAEFLAAALPAEVVKGGMLAPSMVSHVIIMKHVMGVPYYRLEQQFEREGVPLDRSTMCRYTEMVGATLGSIVEAMKVDAKNAFCLSTDATGISIQPAPLPDSTRQPCRKGHFFVVLADHDHIFFEYRAKHDSNAVCEMFRGFGGFIQADAHAIYNALYRGEANEGLEPPVASPVEVGCWSHTRTKFWEAAMAKSPIGREGVLRIRKMFQLDASWAKEPPNVRQRRRTERLAPLVDAFFEWAKDIYPIVKDERGFEAAALGYAIRQEQALRAFLRDPRLRMENNRSERELRQIAVGRKAWLFCGSDDHASAAANLFSLIASCKLHGLDPEQYLTEMIQVLPQWPPSRHLELAPKYWMATRAQVAKHELAREIGPVNVPPVSPPL